MKCAQCKGTRLANARQDMTAQVGSVTYVGQVATLKCEDCGAASVHDSDLERFELSVAEHSMRHGNPAAIKFARKALGFRAYELADLLGLRAETISGWERGVLQPAQSWFAVIATLAAEKLEGRSTLARELRAQREVKAIPEGVVRIAA